MKIYINKDLIFFFKYFISSYNIAILSRKNEFKMPYVKNISNLVLPYFVKTNLIRSFKVFSKNGTNVSVVYLKYNQAGGAVYSKLKLCYFKKSFFKMNRFVLNKIIKNNKQIFNYNYYFIYNSQIYDLNDLKLLKLKDNASIYIIFKNF